MDSQRHPVAARGSQGQPKIGQREPEAGRDSKRQPETARNSQREREEARNGQRQTEAARFSSLSRVYSGSWTLVEDLETPSRLYRLSSQARDHENDQNVQQRP